MSLVYIIGQVVILDINIEVDLFMDVHSVLQSTTCSPYNKACRCELCAPLAFFSQYNQVVIAAVDQQAYFGKLYFCHLLCNTLLCWSLFLSSKITSLYLADSFITLTK